MPTMLQAMEEVVSEVPPVEVFRERFRLAILAAAPSAAQQRWRLGLFERGLRIADELEARAGSVSGKCVLDVGSAFGGDVAAFCARGATCIGLDRFDHDYAALKERIDAGGRLGFVLSDALAVWPFGNESFDVVLSMSVLELVDDLDLFFSELIRVLKPGGVAVVDTGTALRMARRDPLYGLPLVSLLPTPLRRWVMERVFRRRYRFCVSNHTFWSAGRFKRLAARGGFEARACKFEGSAVMRRVSRWPAARVWQFLVRHLAYDFVLIHKPGEAERT